MSEPVTDLDHARYDRDGWMESALTAQRRVADLEAENARLCRLADFVAMWCDRGPPHGGLGNETVALDAIRNHPTLRLFRYDVGVSVGVERDGLTRNGTNSTT